MSLPLAMEHQFIRITRKPYEEPFHVCLLVTGSNGRVRAELAIYANAEDLRAAADQLAGFPSRPDDEFIWELGSERPADDFAYCFRFRVASISRSGTCVVQLRFNNNRPVPDREMAEFCISAEPADIDRLALLLGRFARLEHTALEWRVQDGAVW